MDIRDGEQILEMMRAYQVPCMLAAAVDLDLFEKLVASPRTAAEVASDTGCDLRAVTILLDALSAVGFIDQDRQSVCASLQPWSHYSAQDRRATSSPCCVIRPTVSVDGRVCPGPCDTGSPDSTGPSIGGEELDDASFIEAMHVVSRGVAGGLIGEIHPGGSPLCAGPGRCFRIVDRGLVAGRAGCTGHHL